MRVATRSNGSARATNEEKVERRQNLRKHNFYMNQHSVREAEQLAIDLESQKNGCYDVDDAGRGQSPGCGCGWQSELERGGLIDKRACCLSPTTTQHDQF